VPSGKTGNNFIAELPATQTYIPQSPAEGFLRGGIGKSLIAVIPSPSNFYPARKWLLVKNSSSL
jgi:hypothetical protein